MNHGVIQSDRKKHGVPATAVAYTALSGHGINGCLLGRVLPPSLTVRVDLVIPPVAFHKSSIHRRATNNL